MATLHGIATKPTAVESKRPKPTAVPAPAQQPATCPARPRGKSGCQANQHVGAVTWKPKPMEALHSLKDSIAPRAACNESVILAPIHRGLLYVQCMLYMITAYAYTTVMGLESIGGTDLHLKGACTAPVVQGSALHGRASREDHDTAPATRGCVCL